MTRALHEPKPVTVLTDGCITVSVPVRFYDELRAREMDTYTSNALLPDRLAQANYLQFYLAWKQPIKRTSQRVWVKLSAPAIRHLKAQVPYYNLDTGWDNDVSWFMKRYPSWVQELCDLVRLPL